MRVEFFGDEIDRITQIDVLTGEIKGELTHAAIFPASHYVVPAEQIRRAADAIEEELEERVKYFKSEDKLLEAQRIAERTNFDIEMLKETGFCSGIENYSRHLSGLKPGQPPYTLMDFFKDDFLIIIDESHKTLPQIGAMYHGDQSRKHTLVDYGFRLPSAPGQPAVELSGVRGPDRPDPLRVRYAGGLRGGARAYAGRAGDPAHGPSGSPGGSAPGGGADR